jgi:membrane protein DedA with SNARE-associated domain
MAVVIGMAIGAVAGSITSFVLRLGIRGVQWDALLGSIGYVAATLIPWPRSSTNHNVGTTIVTVALAAMLPILRELYRSRKKVAIKSAG